MEDLILIDDCGDTQFDFRNIFDNIVSQIEDK